MFPLLLNIILKCGDRGPPGGVLCGPVASTLPAIQGLPPGGAGLQFESPRSQAFLRDGSATDTHKPAGSLPPQLPDLRPGSGPKCVAAAEAPGSKRCRREDVGSMEAPLSPRESARFVAENSRDVLVDREGVRRAAELLLPAAVAWRVEQWKSLHELNPRGADEAALDWVFVVDSLNFSFWAEREDRKCEVRYGGTAYTGYWALCAAVNRALDQGGCRPPGGPREVTSARSKRPDLRKPLVSVSRGGKASFL